MISFLFILMELLVAAGIVAGIYYKDAVEAALAGGELYAILLIVILGIIELILIISHINRGIKKREASSELTYTVGEPQGSYFWGFIIGFLFNIIGLLITLFASKSNTKKGALIGVILFIGLVVFTYFGYTILKA